MSVTRRQALKRGLAGVTLVAAGGLVWRAWDNGAFNPGAGPPYALWRDWRETRLDGTLAVARAGILASNAHNTQPWRFTVGPRGVALYADPGRNIGSFDPFSRELSLSLGCALENMVLAADAQGGSTLIMPTEGRRTSKLDPSLPVAILIPERAGAAAPPLFDVIDRRHTNRGPYEPRRVLSPALKTELEALADMPRVRLMLIDDDPRRGVLGRLIVSATESIVADPVMAADSARWFRFSRRDIDRHRDGITLDATGLPDLVNVAAKLISSPSPELADRQWLGATRDVHVATAPMFGIIAVEDPYDLGSTLEAGRLWQRLHLWATARGLAAQPLNQPAECVDRDHQLARPSPMEKALASLTGNPAWRPTFIFRLGYAERAARPSPRRAVEDAVTREA